jgi:hypothetical protein
VTNWIAQRLPTWESIIDPEAGRPWFTERYNGTTSASQFLASSVLAPLSIANATEGKSRPQIRKYRANMSTSYRVAGLNDHRHLKRLTVGGALRWDDKGTIGYYKDAVGGTARLFPHRSWSEPRWSRSAIGRNPTAPPEYSGVH